MITPTLFVGLGTTGTNILKELRKLMSEEYGHAGLPLFRYIAIETNGEVKVQNANQMKDYERINLISATIANVSPIRHKLTPGDPLHNPELVNWLDPELLKIEVGSFIAGASNIRMAGRLCLWENWPTVQNTFNNALGAIIAPATTRATEEILSQRNKIAGNPLDKGGTIKIYVVGSLCGGSCSGMLIDVAYYFRHLLRGYGDQSRIYGIFTIFDENHAANPDGMNTIRAANCYASLLELNYYHHQDTTYDITFPDGRKIENMRKKPFDYTLFVSPGGKIAGNQFVKRNGDFDEEGLNLMVALNLFAESAADTGGRKDEIRTNYTSHSDFGTLKPVPQGEIRTMIRYMASFGLTAVWYPKYRIASAAACSIGNKLCDNWLESHIPQATIVRDVEKAWDTILREKIDSLTSPVGLPPIKSRIDTHLTQAKQKWIKQDSSSNQLSQNMEDYPVGDSFRKKFEEGGEYVELMKMQVPVCQKAFRNAIEQTLNNQLASIDFAGTRGLDDVKMFFERLDEDIEKTIQNCPERMPILDLKKLDFEPMDKAYSNFWLKSIFLRDESVKSHRDNLIDQYRNFIIGSRTSFYESVRNYFIRPILQEIRTELGFGVAPMDTDAPTPTRTIKQRLEQIETNLNNCVNKFKEGYQDAMNPPRSECVKIVANDSENRIDKDAEVLSHQIAQSDDGIELLRGETMASFLMKEQEDIIAQMTGTYRQLSLNRIQVDDVVTKAQELFDSGSSDIQNLASRSNPYQMFKPTYIPFTVSDSPNIIFGHIGETLTNLNNSLGGQGFSFGVGPSSVDHLLFFYQEEAGFALDDLVSHTMLGNKFRLTPGEYGHSTHQNPDFYDLELYHKTQKLQRWCRALQRLVPEICHHINEDAFSDIFYRTKNGYVFEYNVDGLSERLHLHDHLEGIKQLSQKQNETAYDGFFNSVQSCFSCLKREQITQLIDSLLREVDDTKAQATLVKFYRQFLNEVYPNGDFIDNTNSDAEADLESHFSKVSFQTHQDTPFEEAPSTPTEPNQNVHSKSAENTTADSSDDYGDINVEETEVEVRTFNQSGSTSGAEDYSDNTDANESTVSSDDTTDEVVWTEAEPETEHGPTEETTEEEPSPEQQPQPEVVPETDTQQKQKKPAKPFSVADVDPKLLHRDSPRKKE